MKMKFSPFLFAVWLFTVGSLTYSSIEDGRMGYAVFMACVGLAVAVVFGYWFRPRKTSERSSR